MISAVFLCRLDGRGNQFLLFEYNIVHVEQLAEQCQNIITGIAEGASERPDKLQKAYTGSPAERRASRLWAFASCPRSSPTKRRSRTFVSTPTIHVRAVPAWKRRQQCPPRPPAMSSARSKDSCGNKGSSSSKLLQPKPDQGSRIRSLAGCLQGRCNGVCRHVARIAQIGESGDGIRHGCWRYALAQ